MKLRLNVQVVAPLWHWENEPDLVSPPLPVCHRSAFHSWKDAPEPPCSGLLPSAPGSGTAAARCTRSPPCLEMSGHTHTQSCMIETKAGDVLVPFLCLYKQKWNITGAAGWISVYAVQETASFFKYICIFLLTLAFCITQIEQRQEADCSYQERASESELYCSSDQTGRDSTNTEKSVERLHCNSDASVRHLHHHMKSPLEFKQDKMRQSVKPVVFSWTPRWSLQPSRSLPGGDTRWRSRSRRPAAQGATATVGTVSPTRNIMWT